MIRFLLYLAVSVIRVHWNNLRSQKKLYQSAERRIIRGIHRAYKNVPCYRQLYDSHGVTISDIKTLDDLQKLPFITKDNPRPFSEGHRLKKIRSKKVPLFRHHRVDRQVSSLCLQSIRLRFLYRNGSSHVYLDRVSAVAQGDLHQVHGDKISPIWSIFPDRPYTFDYFSRKANSHAAEDATRPPHRVRVHCPRNRPEGDTG